MELETNAFKEKGELPLRVHDYKLDKNLHIFGLVLLKKRDNI